MIYILVTYDVNTTDKDGRRRLRKVAKCCINYGQRVQNSVFECMLPEAQFIQFRAALTALIDPCQDSIRIYRLGKNYVNNIEHIGVKTSFDFGGDLII